MIDYGGTTTLVTGGGSGIGRAMAQALAARGARVIVADRNAAGAAETAALCGNGAVALTCDLAEPDAAARLVADAYAVSGRVDLIASNAGVGFNRRLHKANLDDGAVEKLFQINLFAAVRLAQACLVELEARGQRGRLLITGSENSLSVPAAVKGFGLGLYAATKHGVLILAEWLRDEMAGGNKPLDVHILLPGGVYTPLVAGDLPPDPAKWPKDMAMILPERCAELALAGLDAGLFYIPTHAHLAADMQPRHDGVADAVKRLGLA